MPLRASVLASPGRAKHRERAAPVRAEPQGDGARLARGVRPGDRRGPGQVGSLQRKPQRLPRPDGPHRRRRGGHRSRPGSLAPGARQRRLAPAAADRRHHRYPDPRRDRHLRSERRQRQAAARVQGDDVGVRASGDQGAAARRTAQRRRARRAEDPVAGRPGLQRQGRGGVRPRPVRRRRHPSRVRRLPCSTRSRAMSTGSTRSVGDV